MLPWNDPDGIRPEGFFGPLLPFVGISRGARVILPVVNLRKSPCDAREATFEPDDEQETQLLWNERVEVLDEHRGFLQVAAWEQRRIADFPLSGPYKGWAVREAFVATEALGEANRVVVTTRAEVVDKPESSGSHLACISLGTLLCASEVRRGFVSVALPQGGRGWVRVDQTGELADLQAPEGLRHRLVRSAELLLGMRYLWGGRCAHMPQLPFPATGVDCSGFVSLCYRANGLFLSRNAEDQWRECAAVPLESVLPGDLLFLSRVGRATSIRHVMMALSGERLVEAPGSGDTVRISTFREKFGLSAKELGDGNMLVEGETLYAGRPPGVFEGRVSAHVNAASLISG